MRSLFTSVARELLAVAEEVAAQRRLFLAAMPRPRVVPVAVSENGHSGYGRTCSLCGDPADAQVCGSCAGHFERGGVL